MSSLISLFRHCFSPMLFVCNNFSVKNHWGTNLVMEVMLLSNHRLFIFGPTHCTNYLHYLHTGLTNVIPKWEITYLTFLLLHVNSFYIYRYWISNSFFATWVTLNWLLDNNVICRIEKVAALYLGYHYAMSDCTNVKLMVRLSNRLTVNSTYGRFLVQSLSKDSASKSLPSVISSLRKNRLAIMNRLLLLSLSSNRGPSPRLQLDNVHLLTGVLIQVKGKTISRTPKVRTSTKQIRIGSTSHKTSGVSTSHYRIVYLTQIGTIEVALTKAYTLLNHVDPVAHRL